MIFLLRKRSISLLKKYTCGPRNIFGEKLPTEINGISKSNCCDHDSVEIRKNVKLEFHSRVQYRIEK